MDDEDARLLNGLVGSKVGPQRFEKDSWAVRFGPAFTRKIGLVLSKPPVLLTDSWWVDSLLKEMPTGPFPESAPLVGLVLCCLSADGPHSVCSSTLILDSAAETITTNVQVSHTRSKGERAHAFH